VYPSITSNYQPTKPAKKEAKGSQTWEGCSEELIGQRLSLDPVSNCKIAQWGSGLKERLLVSGCLLELSQHVLTQREKQSRVGDVTTHPEESNKDKASSCVHPKYTALPYTDFFCSQSLTHMEEVALVIQTSGWKGRLGIDVRM
jgi:hypothetical protein